MSDEISEHGQVILFLRSNQGKTCEEIATQAGMTPRVVRRVLRGLADAGLAFDDVAERWRVSATADPNKPLVRATVLSSEKRKKRQRRERAKTADVRARLHAAFLVCVHTVASRMPQFTADDVRREFDASEASAELGKVDPRLSGPVMVHAQKEGYCKRSDMSLVSERRRSGLTQVYISLICEQPADPVDLMTIEELRAEVRRLRAASEGGVYTSHA